MKRKPQKKPADPLKLTCIKADCKNGLHAFRPTKELTAEGREGECLECHQKFFDFDRVRQRNLSDAANTFSAMRMEYVRHWFWTSPLNDKAEARATRQGWERTRTEMEKRLRSSVAPAEPFRDGWQTPIDNPKNIVYWAQHATACCCRRCIEYWHGIERGRDLTDEEIQYLLTLAMMYVDARLPELKQ